MTRDVESSPVPSEKSGFPRRGVRCDENRDPPRLEKIIDLLQVRQRRAHMLDQVRAVNEIEPHVRRRSKILDLDGVSFKPALPANVYGAFRHVDPDSTDSMNLVHRFQSQAESTSDVEPFRCPGPLEVFRYRADAPFEH